MSTIKKEHIKLVPGSKAPVLEVSGGEEFVDKCAAVASQAKQAAVTWDSTKKLVRSLGIEARNLAEEDGMSFGQIRILGTDGNFLEVQPSSRRKGLNEDMVNLAKTVDSSLVTEEVTVVLTGDAAKWVLKAIHDPYGPALVPSEVDVQRTYHLSSKYEEKRRWARAAHSEHVSALDELGEAGCYAPAIESKTK